MTDSFPTSRLSSQPKLTPELVIVFRATWEPPTLTFLKQPFRDPCLENRDFNLQRDTDENEAELTEIWIHTNICSTFQSAGLSNEKQVLPLCLCVCVLLTWQASSSPELLPGSSYQRTGGWPLWTGGWRDRRGWSSPPHGTTANVWWWSPPTQNNTTHVNTDQKTSSTENENVSDYSTRNHSSFPLCRNSEEVQIKILRLTTKSENKIKILRKMVKMNVTDLPPKYLCSVMSAVRSDMKESWECIAHIGETVKVVADLQLWAQRCWSPGFHLKGLWGPEIPACRWNRRKPSVCLEAPPDKWTYPDGGQRREEKTLWALLDNI